MFEEDNLWMYLCCLYLLISSNKLSTAKLISIKKGFTISKGQSKSLNRRITGQKKKDEKASNIVLHG